MSRSKEKVPVSRKKVQYYMEQLGLTVSKLTKAAQDARSRESTEPTGDGPSEQAISRMMREQIATKELARVVLIALQELSNEAHENPESSLNPDNLPVPVDLILFPSKWLRPI